MAVRVGNSTMVVTAWYAERKNEYGLILCNDFALGDLFGGAERFVARLAAQGFGNVRAMATPEELRPAMDPLAHVGKIEGAWSGPWQTEYPWMAQAQLVEHVLFGDETEKQTEEQ